MYYFDDIKKQKKLKIILESWVGTPFKHKTAVKGKGCDCIHFVGSVFQEIGLFKFNLKTVPDYPPDWHLHNTRELLSEGIAERLSVERVDLNNLINGDIILSHYGKASSHAGIYFDGYVYQALTSIGVRKISFKDTKYRKQMRFCFRIKT